MTDDIKEELKIIISILLNQSKIQEWGMGDKIRFLSSFDYNNQEIAKMLDTTYSMVAKEKSKAKKAKQSE